MKWQAKNGTEAEDILRMLAKHGEPLFKKLDEGAQVTILKTQADKTVGNPNNANAHNDSELAMTG